LPLFISVNIVRPEYTWTLPRTALQLGVRTLIMGILNVTPDSFSDGGQYFDPVKAADRGKAIEDEGGDILDIGGESSRPGSIPVSAEEEMRRVLPVIEKLAPALRIPISVDTWRASVAQRALDAGAQIVNDISAFRFDHEVAGVSARARAGVVLMHSRGSRDQLHQQAAMQDAVAEVYSSLAASIETARRAGIQDTAMVVDPGIGFGKNASESFKVLKSLSVFSTLACPLLVGTSRKSFIRSVTPQDPEARMVGTAATIVAAIMNGAHIVRVHDIKLMRVAAEATDRILQA
jgi:dihydropteroate synthase